MDMTLTQIVITAVAAVIVFVAVLVRQRRRIL